MYYLNLVVGMMLVAVAIWGRRNRDELLSDRLEPKVREKKNRSMQRGAILMLILGLAMILYGLLRIAWPHLQ